MIFKKLLENRLVYIYMAAILIAAIVLRFYRLNSGLWLDEIVTYVKYARLPFFVNVTTFDSENQHFLYSILAHLSLQVFGESNWALRLPAVLFGIGSIAVLFIFAREITSDLEAVLSSALLAFSYQHVWFSQNARGYTALLFWTILSSWLFIRGLRDNQKRTWLFFAFASALGVYTHLTMGFLIIGQILIYLHITLIKRHEYQPIRWVGFWVGFCVMGLLVMLLYAPVISQILQTVGGSEKSVVTAWKNPLWTVYEIFKGLEVSFTGAIFAICALVFVGVGLYGYLRTRPIVLGLLMLPSIIGATAVIAVGHHLWPRFFFFEMGFGVLVIVRGVMTIGQVIARIWSNLTISGKATLQRLRKINFGLALCVGMILVSAISIPTAYNPKQDYQGAYDFIKSNQEPGDAVVTVSVASYVYQNAYQTDWIDITSLDMLNEVRSSANRTWLVYTFYPVLESVYPDITSSIKANFEVIKQFGSTVEGGIITVGRSDFPPN